MTTQQLATKDAKIKAANLKHNLFMKARMADKQASVAYFNWLDKRAK